MDQETKVEEQVTTQPEHSSHDEYAAPRGAFIFSMLLLIFYFGYWAFHWFEIFVVRGV